MITYLGGVDFCKGIFLRYVVLKKFVKFLYSDFYIKGNCDGSTYYLKTI